MIAIVTDSTCDLSQQQTGENEIHVIPLCVNIGQSSLLDGIDISREAFYQMLPTLRSLPTTSAPSPAMFTEVYEGLLSKANQIISIHAAGKLSGAYNAARLAAQQVDPRRIFTLDSGQISMGLGWSVLAAARAAKAGETLEAVLHSAQDTLKRVRFYALINTAEYLARSGRINIAQLRLSTLLDIKPLVELRAGVISSLARIRTWSRGAGRMAEQVTSLGKLDQLAVMHTNFADGAQAFLDQMQATVPQICETLVVNATTAIGVNVGPHALGVAAVVSEQ
jgi:DegV family protein with EDD domain